MRISNSLFIVHIQIFKDKLGNSKRIGLPLPLFVIRGDVPRPLPGGMVSCVSAQGAQCNEIISDDWPSTNDE